ncbi:MAG TPA: ferredoxin--NADP reductase [Usitatibacter sp.]|nr:ferredoxin--NADP reductase [Usitatibacter sp.]
MNDLSHGAPPVAKGAAIPSHTCERITRVEGRGASLVAFDTTRPEGFRFTPGHYARLGVGPGEDIVWRPYSIASPADADRLSFRFTRVPDGAFNRRFERLRAGDEIRLDRRSFGFLTLAQVAPGGVLWLLATGTGIAPFVSIAADPSTWKRHERVIVVHSVRREVELASADLEHAMSRHSGAERARLRFVPVVTREHVPGAFGTRIGALLREGTLESVTATRIEPTSSRVLLCGNPDMIRETRAWLRERRLEAGRRGLPGQLATEGYW